jgi:hypothetical protein
MRSLPGMGVGHAGSLDYIPESQPSLQVAISTSPLLNRDQLKPTASSATLVEGKRMSNPSPLVEGYHEGTKLPEQEEPGFEDPADNSDNSSLSDSDLEVEDDPEADREFLEIYHMYYET